MPTKAILLAFAVALVFGSAAHAGQTWSATGSMGTAHCVGSSSTVEYPFE